MIIRNIPSETSPSKMDLVIRYEFPYELLLAEIKLIYNVLIDICRLLTNRKNVGFDVVKLYKIDEKTQELSCFADAFIDYKYEQFTNKSYRNNILFDYLGDCISNLHTVVSSGTERKENYLMGFFAESDSDYNVLTDDKVKNICSSIECELNFIMDLKNDENENLKDLIKLIKKVLKHHKKSANRLEDKTYGLIYNSMSHWSINCKECGRKEEMLIYEYIKEDDDFGEKGRRIISNQLVTIESM